MQGLPNLCCVGPVKCTCINCVAQHFTCINHVLEAFVARMQPKMCLVLALGSCLFHRLVLLLVVAWASNVRNTSL